MNKLQITSDIRYISFVRTIKHDYVDIVDTYDTKSAVKHLYNKHVAMLYKHVLCNFL